MNKGHSDPAVSFTDVEYATSLEEGRKSASGYACISSAALYLGSLACTYHRNVRTSGRAECIVHRCRRDIVDSEAVEKPSFCHQSHFW